MAEARDKMSAFELWRFNMKGEQMSGEFSRALAKAFLGENRGRTVSRIVTDVTGLPTGIFHILLVSLGAWGVSRAVSRQDSDAVDKISH